MHKKTLFTFVLVLGVLQSCSDDEQSRIEGVDKKEVIHSPLRSGEETQGKPNQPEEERALKIGIIGPETGREAEFGLRVLEGATLAARVFNVHGGIGGKAIEIIHYDNKGDPELTSDGVQRLIQQRVIAILAAPTGWSTFATTYMANASHTIFFSIGTRRRIGKSGPYIFRSSLPDELAIDELIYVSAKELGYSDYALVTSSSYDYSLDLSALFRKSIAKYGGRLGVVADTYDTYTGETDLSGVIKAIKGSPKPLHAIIYTGGPDEGGLLAQLIRRAGIMLPIIGGEDLFTETYLKAGGSAVRGTLLYSTFSPENDSEKVVEFIKDYKKETGNAPDRFVALAYDTFMLVAQAIDVAGSTKSSVVRDAIIDLNYDGVTGQTAFTPEGAPIKHPFIYRVEGSKSGERFSLLGQ